MTMRHIRTYNEAAGSPGYRRVDQAEMEKRMTRDPYDLFDTGEVDGILDKAIECGWSGELVEYLSEPTLGIQGFYEEGEVVRTIELSPGAEWDIIEEAPPLEAVEDSEGGNNLWISFGEEIPSESKAIDIFKSEDDYFFVIGTSFFSGDDYYTLHHYVCDGMDGLFALMESLPVDNFGRPEFPRSAQ